MKNYNWKEEREKSRRCTRSSIPTEHRSEAVASPVADAATPKATSNAASRIAPGGRRVLAIVTVACALGAFFWVRGTREARSATGVPLSESRHPVPEASDSTSSPAADPGSAPAADTAAPDSQSTDGESYDETGGQDAGGCFYGPRSANGKPCFTGSRGPYRDAFLQWSAREIHRRNMVENPMAGAADTARWLQDMEASTGLKYVFEMAREKERELRASLWINPEFQAVVDDDLKAENLRVELFEVYYQREMECLRRERERIDRESQRSRRHDR